MVKNLPANTGNADLTPGWGRSPGVENGNPLQDSYLENSMDRGAWQATVHGIPKSWTRLSTHARTHTHTHTQFFLEFFSAISHYKVLSIVPCTINRSLFIYFV